MARYPNISDHGLIGDLQTAALVSTDGCVDWFCCPRFDSPSVFGALLDADKGGYFQVKPDRDDYVTRQLYFPDTAILITRFMTPDGVGEVRRLHADRGPAGDQPPPAGPADPGGPRHDEVRRRHQAALRLRPQGTQAGAHRRGRGVPRRRHGTDRALRGPPRCHPGRPGHRVRADRRGPAPAPDAARGPEHRDGAGMDGRPPAAAARGRRAATVRRHRRLLAELAAQVHLHRPVAGDGDPVGHDAQADDVRADRRAGRRAHRRAARADRRGAELGLPVHLDPGRLVLGVRPARAGLPGGGGRVRHLGPGPAGRAGGQQRRQPAQDHVPGGRVFGSHRGDPGPLGGLARLAPGPHRERRIRPAPAGHLRRGAGRHVARGRPGPAGGPPGLDRDSER